ncbi:MAG: hypothetical protein PHH98_05145 [Candidatus Gracilibacteria bacterium]|nr:hypothetical protein [Candidatus Gracilibacteria bacterium]
MKYLYILIVTIFLASCGASVEENKITTTDENTTEVTNDINSEVNSLDEQNEDTSKVTKIEANYTNPAGPVDMVISYSLDSEGKIETIDLSATTFDLTEYNKSAQVLVGKTIDEAKITGIAGASLLNEAFKNALK